MNGWCGQICRYWLKFSRANKKFYIFPFRFVHFYLACVIKATVAQLRSVSTSRFVNILFIRNTRKLHNIRTMIRSNIHNGRRVAASKRYIYDLTWLRVYWGEIIFAEQCSFGQRKKRMKRDRQSKWETY